MIHPSADNILEVQQKIKLYKNELVDNEAQLKSLNVDDFILSFEGTLWRVYKLWYQVGFLRSPSLSNHILPYALLSRRIKWWANGISWDLSLTHWGRVTHICVNNPTITGSDNGLSPSRRQAIIWTNARLLLIETLGTNFSEILIEILTFSFKKMRLKVSSAKRWPFCLGLNVLRWVFVWFGGISYITKVQPIVQISFPFGPIRKQACFRHGIYLKNTSNPHEII